MNMYKAEPFDSNDFIFELKHDGARCLAYIGKDKDFISRKHNSFVYAFPELSQIESKEEIILDGELIVINNGKADFSELQKRLRIGDKSKIERAANNMPAQFVAFDILYCNGKNLTTLPLMERKAFLTKYVREDGTIVLSRFIENCGTAFFDIVAQQRLEGIVAKKKQSNYFFGRRTKEWLKIKTEYARDYILRNN